MAVDYEKLGELIDGYDGIAADDLHALPSVADAREDEIARTNDENKQMREALADVEDENKRLRQALTEIELILIDLRDRIVGDDSDVLGGSQA